MRAAAVFSNDMVLQREKPIAVFGDGKDGERVMVTLGGHSASGTVSAGRWRVTLPPMPAADGLTMTVQGDGEPIVFTGIAIGEVWLCGGQSNMEFEIRGEKNGEALLQMLTPECGVRYYYTPKQRMIDAQFDAVERNTCWTKASPESAGAWSAVGLYFALEIANRLGITVGLIGCNWGGTSASAWVSRESLAAHPSLMPYLNDYDRAVAGRDFDEMIAEFDAYAAYQEKWYTTYNAYLAEHPETTWEEAQKLLGPSKYPGPMGPKNENRPCGLYETLVQRVCPYTLRGFLFYQGESDDHRPDTYETLLESLIRCWRKDWGDDALPFLNVQLPMFRYVNEEDRRHWCLIREAQANVYRRMRNTGLAVLTDCGELDNIHPTDKAPVGKRLALQALCEVYGMLPRATASAPMLRSAYAAGNTFVALIDNADDGFLLKGEPCGFELAGADGAYHPAKAVFEAGRITLTAEEVPSLAAARYAWTNYMQATVFGRNGLPLAPFRTAK